MEHFTRHLRAAIGFLELGLPLDAPEEFEAIEPGMRTLSEVLTVHVEIFRVLGKWELMEAVEVRLCKLRPDEPQWFISLAFARRRTTGVQQALALLAQVAPRFPTCATILFNIACCAAQLGHLDTARARLAEAIKLDSACRELALTDPDLSPLRGTLDQTASF